MGINLLSPNWWVSQFVSTFITIMFLFLIKKAFSKVDVPVISDVVAQA